jgi:hypothetical protein
MLMQALPIAFWDIFSDAKIGLFYARSHGFSEPDNPKIEALA